MTKKDLTIVGILAVVSVILFGVMVKSGGTKPPVPKPAPMESDASPSETRDSRSEVQSTTNTGAEPTNAAIETTPATTPVIEHQSEATSEPETANSNSQAFGESDANATSQLTAQEIALRFQAALNGTTTGSSTGAEANQDTSSLIATLFADLPDTPEAQGELASELATAYLQSSDDNEKSALIDVLMILPSNAATQLGQTLSQSANPEERQIGLDLLSISGTPEMFGN